MLWFRLLTGPEVTSLPGLIVAGRLQLAEAMGWSPEAFDKAFAEAFQQGMVKADWKARVVWLPNAVKYNKPQSPNVVKSWRDHLDNTPECELKAQAYQALKAFAEGLGKAFAKAFAEAFGEAFGKPLPYQEQEQEQEQEQDSCSAAASQAAEPVVKSRGRKTSPSNPKAREPNQLFDAIAEATGHDPNTAGGHIGKVAATLKAAGYTAEDVKRFVKELPVRFPWAKGNLTPSFIEQHIGTVKTPMPTTNTTNRGTRNGQRETYRFVEPPGGSRAD